MEKSRPLWSVMVPVCNRTKYLAEALNSVISAGYDPDDMQIEIIDNHSQQNDAEVIANNICPRRIAFYRQPHRVEMAANFNTCIERARGELVHILHDDDFVARGYYQEIEGLAKKYPEVGLYATRSFVVDGESIIYQVSRRVTELERSSKSAIAFFYEAPVDCAGVTVRRASYQASGGYNSELKYTLDCEMWARITSNHGAVISPNVEAFYRIADGNESARLWRTAESVRDVCRLNEIFAHRHPEFSIEAGRARVRRMAWEQYQLFKARGDDVAAAANWEIWAQFTPTRHRLARRLSSLTTPYIRRLAFGTRA